MDYYTQPLTPLTRVLTATVWDEKCSLCEHARVCVCVSVWVRSLASCMLVTGWDHLINGLMNSPFHRWDELTLLCSLSVYSKSPLYALWALCRGRKNNAMQRTTDVSMKELTAVYKRFIFISLLFSGFIINCVFWIVWKYNSFNCPNTDHLHF